MLDHVIPLLRTLQGLPSSCHLGSRPRSLEPFAVLVKDLPPPLLSSPLLLSSPGLPCWTHTVRPWRSLHSLPLFSQGFCPCCFSCLPCVSPKDVRAPRLLQVLLGLYPSPSTRLSTPLPPALWFSSWYFNCLILGMYFAFHYCLSPLTSTDFARGGAFNFSYCCLSVDICVNVS